LEHIQTSTHPVELPSGAVWKRHTDQILKNKYKFEEEEVEKDKRNFEEEKVEEDKGNSITEEELTVDETMKENKDNAQETEKEQSSIEEDHSTKVIQASRRSSRPKKPVVKLNL